jgi:hypothetical protein
VEVGRFVGEVFHPHDGNAACNPVFTYNLFGDAECNFSVSSGVTCPVMGQLLNTGFVRARSIHEVAVRALEVVESTC